jgi:phenylalanyl-tRNA synthetase beta chain
MNVSYQWLCEYCDPKLPPDELARLLPEYGMEVDAVRSVGSDTVYELEIGANRPDLLSMIGIAREVSAAVSAELRTPEPRLECSGPNVTERTSVDLACPDLCLRYTARLVTGVQVGPSPDWLQKRLEAAGLRPVNNIVDITNFVLLECGQPLHAFDFDKLRGGRIVVRRARLGERLTVIDGTEHELTGEMCVIADAEVPTAVAGVMGGLATEIGEQTSTVLLESAEFLPASIRRTSRALGLSSDSSYRFERGVDPRGVDWGSERAAALIADLAGGEVAAGMIDVGRAVPEEPVVTLRATRASGVIGAEIPARDQKAMLARLGFQVAVERPDALDVRVPSFRAEVTREVDLIEEVARAYGYGNVPEETTMRVRAVPVQRFDAIADRVRDVCAGTGYHEAVTSSFVPTELGARFQHWSAEVDVLRNPVSREEPALRTSLLPTLLLAKRMNANRGAGEIGLFEISRVYGATDGTPDERTCLALLDDGGFPPLRGTLDAVFEHLRVAGRLTWAKHSDPNLSEGAAAQLRLDDTVLGMAGVISGELAEAVDVSGRPAVAEVDFDRLVEAAELEPRYRPLPRFPAVRRDLCLVLDEQVPWADLAGCVASEGGELTQELAFLSEYRGEQIPAGKKAVAFSVTYRAADRTLTGEEADGAVGRLVEAMEGRLGAELRT